MWGGTALEFSAMKGDGAIVRMLLDRDDIEVNRVFHPSRNTALSHAASRGHEEVVRLLMNKPDIKADTQDWCGRTPLILAVTYGHASIVRLLLETRDININWKVNLVGKRPVRDFIGWSALSIAVENGNEEIVGLLLKREDIDVGLTKYRPDQIVLTLAMYTGHNLIVDLIFSWYKAHDFEYYKYLLDHSDSLDYKKAWSQPYLGDIHYDSKR
jgi:ankyrin repeat protein